MSQTMESSPGVTTVDIRERILATLKSLDGSIEAVKLRKATLQKSLQEWKARQDRAVNIISQTTGKGKAAGEMLLEQAGSHVSRYESLLSEEEQHAELLSNQHSSIDASLKRFDAFNRVQALESRIDAISPVARELTLGDEKKPFFNQREIEQQIHMINALIELREGQ